ncbi:MAG TPA: helix-turn-helix transcriptional regulator [Terracidiphilus sp.]
MKGSKCRASMLQEQHTCLSKGDLARGAFDEHGPKFFFQFSDRVRQPRLNDIYFARGAGETAFLGECDEMLKMPNLHAASFHLSHLKITDILTYRFTFEYQPPKLASISCFATDSEESGAMRSQDKEPNNIVNISGSLLRMFRAATGTTAQLTERRIERAKGMVQEAEEISLTNIAVWCGFSSQSHMTRVFREHVGITPSAFRRRPDANASREQLSNLQPALYWYATAHHTILQKCQFCTIPLPALFGTFDMRKTTE